MITLAFVTLAVGLILLSVCSFSLPLMMVAVFLAGAALSMCVPQGLFATSNCIDPSNSVIATMIYSCVMPGSSGFLSPIIYANLTTALGGDSTRFRYLFVGIIALLMAVIFALLTMRRAKRQQVTPVG